MLLKYFYSALQYPRFVIILGKYVFINVSFVVLIRRKQEEEDIHGGKEEGEKTKEKGRAAAAESISASFDGANRKS